MRSSSPCPDMETLAAYAEDRLPFEAALKVAAHEKLCPMCHEEVQDLQAFVRQQVRQLVSEMPLWATPFVGRETEQDTLGERLQSGNSQTLTLEAPSGIGKTRIALETAIEYSGSFRDGVWYVPLTGQNETAQATEIARAMQLPLAPNSPPLRQVQDFLSNKQALLVMDEFARNAPTAQVVAQLTGSASELCCLTTTNEKLGLRGEWTLPLHPLDASEEERNPEQMLSGESVQLFLAHVRSYRPETRLDEPEVRSVASLCQRAGGMPLAIELTAARMREMSPQEMLGRMSPLTAPREGQGDPLKEMLAWSYGLLSEREKRFLQRLSVFVGGFFVEQAEEVCREGEAHQLVENLYHNALLQRTEALGRPRYQLLLPVQEFARRQLGEQKSFVQQHHSAYFLQYAQERAEKLEDSRQVEASQELSTDLPNLRAGMDTAQETEAHEDVGQYGLALNRSLTLQGLWHECLERLSLSEQAFARLGEQEKQQKVQLALAHLHTRRGEYTKAETLLNRLALEAVRLGDIRKQAEVSQGLGNLAQFRRLYPEAISRFEKALQHFEALQDRRGIADCFQNLGWLAWKDRDYPRAEQWLQKSLPLQRERGERSRLGTTLAVLGNVVFEQKHWEEARLLFAEALQVRQEVGEVRGIASSFNNMGMVWRALEEFPRAEYCFTRALRCLESFVDNRLKGQVLGDYGELALAEGNFALARERVMASLALFTEANVEERVEAEEQLAKIAAKEGDYSETL